MLKFKNDWRFESPGKISTEILNDFYDIIVRISKGDQKLLEHFKTYFANAAGLTSGWSSNAGWAATDLNNYMDSASENAPLFIEAFYDACSDLSNADEDIPVPGTDIMNKILFRHSSQYSIHPPDLIVEGDEIQAPVPEIPLSLDQEARNIIQKSISESQKLLIEGRYRQAVQEVLWLLETVTTVFQDLTVGDQSISGKYFNKIINDLKKHNKEKTLERVISWINALHGYLSAPTGGGVRHGTHIKEGIEITKAEAVLYCNLINSYTNYLLSEYERLKSE